MQPQRILILGSGVVGQVFGGMLHRAGHIVTFFTRPSRAEALRTQGIRLLLRKKRTELRITGLRVSDDILLFDEFDFVFVCFRGDQVDQAEALLSGRRIGPAQVVWCMPLWPARAAELAARLPDSHYLMPGIAGVFREEGIEVSIQKTALAPLDGATEDKARSIAELLSQAGIPTKVRRGLPERVAGAIAVSFPLFLGHAVEGWDLKRFRGNAARLRLVHAAQIEALHLLEAEGVHLPGPFRSYRKMSGTLFAALYRTASLCFPAFARDMLTVHFRKTHGQQIAMLQDLCARAPSGNAPALHQLITLAADVGRG